ncbi:GntR family transcriptional regulator [Erwiniaceae bacterium CAU 1747]
MIQSRAAAGGIPCQPTLASATMKADSTIKQAGQQRPCREVATLLRTLIIRQPYTADNRLPPERAIAERLSVSRAVVRAAPISFS